MPAATTVAIAVRYRDIDAMGHVNNAVYATHPETARAALFTEHLDIALTAAPTVLASLQIDYHAPITLCDAVTVRCAIVRGRPQLHPDGLHHPYRRHRLCDRDDRAGGRRCAQRYGRAGATGVA